MADTGFRIKIFTPAGLALEESVTSVTLQGIDGQMGILPRHTRYTGLLGNGTLQYSVEASGQSKSVKLTGGLCNFSSDTLTVLADSIA